MGCTSTKATTEAVEEVELSLSPENCRLLIVTWNVGNAAPPDDLSALFGRKEYDLIVIGAQECEFGSVGDKMQTHKYC